MIHFLNENIRTVKFSEVLAHDLYKRYLKYCRHYEEEPLTFRRFNKQMVLLGFVKRKDHYRKLHFKDVYLLKCKY